MFYFNKGLGKLDVDFTLTPRSEIELYIQSKKIPENKIFLFRVREFEKKKNPKELVKKTRRFRRKNKWFKFNRREKLITEKEGKKFFFQT